MGFNSIAIFYDRLARLVFGQSLKRAQTYFFERIPPSSNVLVVGGGTGWWLNQYLRDNPSCKIYYVEESSEMIRLAQKMVANDPRITFKRGTHNSISCDCDFDVVILFCFLDIFSNDQLNEVVERIARSMKVNSLWLITEFVDTSWWHSAMLAIMYRFFRITTGLTNQKLPDWQKSLSSAQLKAVDQRLFFGGFIKSALYKGDVCVNINLNR